MSKQEDIYELEHSIELVFPTARPGFIKILVQALELHAKKNNDYNGKKVLFPPTTSSLYYDVRRKMGRLFNIMDG